MGKVVDNCGYMGKILRVDLSTGEITETSTMDYASRYIGRRGIGTRIYWDEVSPGGTGAFDPGQPTHCHYRPSRRVLRPFRLHVAGQC
ncbi:aldehyde ferredoxin oxidoreductase N-terminal domain-containing protein [Chloroflexota bacterium]